MKPRIAALALCLAALAACKREAPPAAQTPAPAAATAVADETTPTAAGAEAFVRRLYREFEGFANAPPEADARPPERARTYDKSMLDLLAQTEKLANGDEGPWEADPMCECQDPAGMTNEITMGSASGTTSTAKVKLGFGPKVWQELTLDLVYEDGHWRVHDIESGDLPSARESLVHYIKEMGGGSAKKP